MISAFGVDHGYEEIEKFGALGIASKVGGLGTKIASHAMGGGTALKSAGAAKVASSKSLALAPRQAQKRNLVGQAQLKTGSLMQRGAGFAARRPQLAGGLAAGGATAGVAGGGFAAGRMGGDKKKLSQYR